MEAPAPDASPPGTTQPLGLVALIWIARKLRLTPRYRLVRLRWDRFKRRLLAKGLVLIYQAEARVRLSGNGLLAKFSTHFSSVLGVVIAGAFAITASDALFKSTMFSAGGFHLACAGIMGTALALVLTLSIVPAQKAADVFSTAILKLYARDGVLWRVYATLALLTLLSTLLGTAWTFGLDPRWTIALQLVSLGIALDALRRFYLRTLDLLVPQTALGLVLGECVRLMKIMARDAHRFARVLQLGGGKHGAPDPSSAQWLSFQSSPTSKHLIGWIGQLEEFAHKAVARRDTQAAKSALMTMAMIGMQYANMRRDSLVMVPDFSGPIPSGTSDVRQVLTPIYESVKNVCQDAARQPDEAVVTACIQELGRMAAHSMTIVHTQRKVWSKAPLSHAPVYYLMVCAEDAAKAKMDDALLSAVRAIGPVFAKISDKVETLAAEGTAIDCLFSIASGSYIRRSFAPADEAVKMMMAVATHELQVRDFDHNHGLRTILNKFAVLVPMEVVLEKAGQRTMQVFAPYGHTGLPTLLIEEAKKIKPDDRHWVDPFHDFEELSREVVLHYRKLADEVAFDGTLLERWIIGSVLDCADVHMHLLAEPPKGSEPFLDTVDNRLRWFIHAPSFFFREEVSFPDDQAKYAAKRLAILGIRLLQLNRLDAFTDCAKALASIGKRAASIAKANAYSVADIFTVLEILTRAADAVGNKDLARECRALENLDEIVKKIPDYKRAIENRTGHLDRDLAEHPMRDDFNLRDDPVPLLRKILREAAALKVHRSAIINLLKSRR